MQVRKSTRTRRQEIINIICKIVEILSKAIESGKVKSEITPRTSAIPFSGLIQSSITMRSYKKFDFVSEEPHSYLSNIYLKGIGV